MALAFPLLASAATASPLLFLGHHAVLRQSPDTITLLARDAPSATIIITGKDVPGPRQSNGTAQINKAADTFLDCLKKITGAQFPRFTALSQKQPPGVRHIFLGVQDGKTFEAFPELKSVDPQGFVIATRGDDLHIVGATGTATLYGVWFFLMNYADVRLIGPDEIGEIMPARAALTIPRELYVLNPGPDFQLRTWSGTGGFPTAAWLADTKDTELFQYHHNLYEIYPPDRFRASHPEYFPVVKGTPQVPPGSQKEGWQPNFSDPNAKQRAIEYADELFQKRPDLKSVSLTVNDGLGYSETDMSQGRLEPDGQIGIGDPYGRYVNTVAAGLQKNWPGKLAAFLPYNLTKFAPTFPLADNVLVFLFKEPKATYPDWEGKVKHLGIYQWLYGMGYVIPNHWPHAMQENLRWLRERGGIAFKGEAYGAWSHDGPKLWVMNNLFWNTDADIDALLQDYYNHAYGPEAASAVVRYFAQAEKIYERHRNPGEFNFATLHAREKQFAGVTEEDFQIMRAALAEARERVAGEGNQHRLQLLEKTFHWADLYWQQYAILNHLQNPVLHSESEVHSLFVSLDEFDRLGAEAVKHHDTQIKPDAPYTLCSKMRGAPLNPYWEPDFHWDNLDAATAAACSAASKYFSSTGESSAAIAARWEKIAQETPRLRAYADGERLTLLKPHAPLKNLLGNASFEEPPAQNTIADLKSPVARDWPVYHSRMVNATIALDRQMKHDGATSLTVRGMTDFSGVRRPLSVPNHARYRLSFWYRTSKETRHIEAGLTSSSRRQIDQYASTEDWTHIEKLILLDDKSASKNIGITVMLGLRHGGSAASQVWIDDVHLEQLSPEGAE